MRNGCGAAPVVKEDRSRQSGEHYNKKFGVAHAGCSVQDVNGGGYRKCGSEGLMAGKKRKRSVRSVVLRCLGRSKVCRVA